MGAVGVVAEYNPFHRGHFYHLRQSRALTDGAPVIAVMSGDFVQRGEAACFSKFARARAAVDGGASLVIELPLPWCLSSAEGFARGAVGLLYSTGVVDAISFGSESADMDLLYACTKTLQGTDYAAELKAELNRGDSFAAARERAVASLSDAETASVLRSPNDLLAVEYVRAAAELGFEAKFLPVLRQSSVHDGPGSASELRSLMAAGEDWLGKLPEGSAAAFVRELDAGRGPVLPERLRLPLMSRLWERTEADLARVPDAAEGLEKRLYRAVRMAASPEEAAMLAKSKRYALSRLRRMAMCAALGVEKGMADGTPPYNRVLAMDGRGAELLRTMRKTARVPVIVKPAHVRRLDERAQRIFALTAAAHDLYTLGFSDRNAQRCGEDYRAVPYIREKGADE